MNNKRRFEEVKNRALYMYRYASDLSVQAHYAEKPDEFLKEQEVKLSVLQDVINMINRVEIEGTRQTCNVCQVKLPAHRLTTTYDDDMTSNGFICFDCVNKYA